MENSPNGAIGPTTNENLSWKQQQQNTYLRHHCVFPGCQKSFQDKEHLNRHAETHSKLPTHTCTVCGRSYARRDVLTRHIQQHLLFLRKRTEVACDECQVRKTTCDDGTPCRNCWSNGYTCLRTRHSRESSESRTINPQPLDAPVADEMSGLYMSSPQTELAPVNPMLEIQPPLVHDGYEIVGTVPGPPNSLLSMSNPSSGWISHVHWTNSSTTRHPTHTTPAPETAFPAQGINSTSMAQDHLSSVTIPDFSQMDHILKDRQPDMATLVPLYFESVHFVWPILHRPTFDPQTGPQIILASIGVIMTWATEADWHRSIAHVTTRVFSQIVAQSIGQKQTETSLSKEELCTLQALVLFIYHLLVCEDCAPSIGLALHLCVWAICRISLTNLSHPHHNSILGGSLHQQGDWVLREQWKRIYFSLIRLDAYISVITGRPTQLRHHATGLLLPVSEELWNAGTSEKVQALQWSEPSGRAQLPFNRLIQEFVLENKYHISHLPLSDLDHHLALCAVQGEIWETSHKLSDWCLAALLTEGNANQPRMPRASYPWHEYFDQLLCVFPAKALVETNAANPTTADSRFSSVYFTPILCHLAIISLYSHSRKLRHDTECTLCEATFHPLGSSFNTSTLTWARTPSARRAIFSAASLLSILWQNAEVTTASGLGRLRGIALNPMSAAARIRAGNELMEYAKSVATCPFCCPNEAPPEPLNLLSDEPVGSKVHEWIANGGPAALESLNICKCNISNIAALFTM